MSRPRTKYEELTRKSTELTQPECVGNVLYLDSAFPEHHSKHVEAVLIRRTPVRGDPCPSRPGQLPLLFPADRLRRCPEVGREPRSDLDEGDQPSHASFTGPARHQIQIPMAVSKAFIQYGPTARLQPARRYRFSLDPQPLSLGQHATSVRAYERRSESDYPPDSFNRCTNSPVYRAADRSESDARPLIFLDDHHRSGRPRSHNERSRQTSRTNHQELCENGRRQERSITGPVRV